MAEVVHHGLNRHRLTHPASALEKVFADAWEETNNPPDYLNSGVGTLAWLVTSKLIDRQEYGLGVDWVPQPELLTQRDAEIAASVIQWLGTHPGFSWLDETLKKGGWKLERIGDGEAALSPQGLANLQRSINRTRKALADLSGE